MVDEANRTAGDIETAREIGVIVAGAAEERPQLAYAGGDRPRLDGMRPLVTKLVHALQDYGVGGDITERRRRLFGREVGAALSLESIARNLGAPGTPVLSGVVNKIGAQPIFDFLVVARLTLRRPALVPGASVKQDSQLDWLRWMERQGVIEFQDPMRARQGFFALLADSLRAVMQKDNPAVTFTVSSRRKGYSLEYFPQYRYSPVVFGSNPTTPVVARLPSGHYYFEGVKSGGRVLDPGVHFVSDTNTRTRLSAF